MNDYHFSQTLDVPLEEAIELVTEALREEGFGLLTEIDVQATIDEKLGIQMPPYRILGFCNANFAYQAILIDRHVGTLLPCSIVVSSVENERTGVSAINPAAVMGVVDNHDLEELARDVTRCLKRGLDRMNAVVQEA